METAEECQVKDFGKNYQLKKITSQKEKLPIKEKKIYMGPYKLLQPPRRWSRPHEPTSIMANAQEGQAGRYKPAIGQKNEEK